MIVILAVIAAVAYTAFCLFRPTKNCRRCGGWGGKPSRWRRRGQRRQCTRCNGTGRRFRVPARVAYRIRGAMRRHATLTDRAAARTAGTDRGDEDREQARLS
jgi:hypothetical protein